MKNGLGGIQYVGLFPVLVMKKQRLVPIDQTLNKWYYIDVIVHS
ncbi:MAG: hypothetical protein RMI79_04995 [Nitrososphaerota archaeon]|nr:hypothetical protein [Nitrososphaerota archaeon]